MCRAIFRALIPLLGITIFSHYVIRDLLATSWTNVESRSKTSSGFFVKGIRGETIYDSGAVARFPTNNFSGVIARAFEPWPATLPLPCFEPEGDVLDVEVYQETTNATQGFLYMKPHKCASTTAAGINLRISRNVAKRAKLNSELCDNRFSHGVYGTDYFNAIRARRFSQRQPTKSFLWTILREPTQRYISFFFFRRVRNGFDASDQSFIEWLLNKNPAHYYLCTFKTTGFDCSPKSVDVMKSEASVSELNSTIVDACNDILNEYDFIGVLERFDESIVVLMMLLGLSISDVLFLNGKVAGGFGPAVRPDQVCRRIPKSYVSTGMEEFFASDAWQRRISSDSLLYQAANRSLDLTIDRLGKEHVERNVALLRHAKNAVDAHCSERIIMPCDTEGVPSRSNNETDCFVRDMGCGMDCLDEVSDNLGLWDLPGK